MRGYDYIKLDAATKWINRFRYTFHFTSTYLRYYYYPLLPSHEEFNDDDDDGQGSSLTVTSTPATCRCQPIHFEFPLRTRSTPSSAPHTKKKDADRRQGGGSSTVLVTARMFRTVVNYAASPRHRWKGKRGHWCADDQILATSYGREGAFF